MFNSNRRNRFKFTEKKQSKKGIIATIMACLCLVIYLVFVRAAFSSKGGLSTYFGSMGVFCMLLSIVAFVIAILTLGEEDSFPLFKRISVITSFLAVLGWIGTYIVGFIF